MCNIVAVGRQQNDGSPILISCALHRNGDDLQLFIHIHAGNIAGHKSVFSRQRRYIDAFLQRKGILLPILRFCQRYNVHTLELAADKIHTLVDGIIFYNFRHAAVLIHSAGGITAQILQHSGIAGGIQM